MKKTTKNKKKKCNICGGKPLIDCSNVFHICPACMKPFTVKELQILYGSKT